MCNCNLILEHRIMWCTYSTSMFFIICCFPHLPKVNTYQVVFYRFFNVIHSFPLYDSFTSSSYIHSSRTLLLFIFPQSTSHNNVMFTLALFLSTSLTHGTSHFLYTSLPLIHMQFMLSVSLISYETPSYRCVASKIMCFPYTIIISFRSIDTIYNIIETLSRLLQDYYGNNLTFDVNVSYSCCL